MLNELNHIPKGLLSLHAARLHEVLDGPTLIHLQGRHPEPIFVSILLHGNEDTGWEAARLLLKKYENRELPRSLSLFIGNISAARDGARHLDKQHDYNRIWHEGRSEEHQMAANIVKIMDKRNVFASIDIHNNTGLNPHYACINVMEHPFLHLATLFSRTVVYFIRPEGVQSSAFSKLCPAVTVECGKPGQSHGIEHALDFIEAALHLDHFPEHQVSPHDYDLFHTVATVKIPDEVNFSFNDSDADLLFSKDIEQYNFRELPPLTPLALLQSESGRIEAWSEEGDEVADRFFESIDNRIYTRLPVMPSMLTLDEEVIRQDCLCYLMERLPSIT
ncbi:MAG: M14 family metallopeptidase [Chromatiales bacterium]|nr:M14 family metallopeptidase [Chromatiales bacterium]